MGAPFGCVGCGVCLGAPHARDAVFGIGYSELLRIGWGEWGGVQYLYWDCFDYCAAVLTG